MSDAEFPVRNHRRGHPLHLFADRRWRWADNGRFVPSHTDRSKDRDCAACGLPPTPEGYDACIGHVPGAINACCGHRVVEPYVMWADRTGASGERVPWLEGESHGPRPEFDGGRKVGQGRA